MKHKVNKYCNISMVDIETIRRALLYDFLPKILEYDSQVIEFLKREAGIYNHKQPTNEQYISALRNLNVANGGVVVRQSEQDYVHRLEVDCSMLYRKNLLTSKDLEQVSMKLHASGGIISHIQSSMSKSNFYEWSRVSNEYFKRYTLNTHMYPESHFMYIAFVLCNRNIFIPKLIEVLDTQTKRLLDSLDCLDIYNNTVKKGDTLLNVFPITTTVYEKYASIIKKENKGMNSSSVRSHVRDAVRALSDETKNKIDSEMISILEKMSKEIKETKAVKLKLYDDISPMPFGSTPDLDWMRLATGLTANRGRRSGGGGGGGSGVFINEGLGAGYVMANPTTNSLEEQVSF